MSLVVRNRSELAQARRQLKDSVALVATMGALHAGHRANIEAARHECDSVVVSIFVNPLQFERASDLTRYPRTLDSDVAHCDEWGVDVVWAPTVAEMYPDGPPRVAVSAGELGAQLEGASRPGHFDGVLTVVSKLFGLIRPDRTFFGEKDFQQLTLVRGMVTDLELGVEVSSVETVRERDGLALSSRNVFLSPSDRVTAAAIPAALNAARGLADATPAGVLAAAHAVLAAADGLHLDYVELRGPQLQPAPLGPQARLLIAGTLGTTRLIDNCAISLGVSELGASRTAGADAGADAGAGAGADFEGGQP